MTGKKGTNKMGIMQAGLHNHPRQQHYGKLWNQIDFYVEEGRRGDGKDGYNNKTIGELVIGNQRVALTWTECSKIQETLAAAKESYKVAKSLDMV